MSKTLVVPGAATKCPFRAALQSQRVHNSAPLTGSPQTKSSPSNGESAAIAGESHNCQCVSSGRKPKGENHML